MESVASGVKTFDAFPKVSSTYTKRSQGGGLVTILLSLFCIFFIWIEFGSYLAGTVVQEFAVEHAVGSNMQVNLDVTIAMPCSTLHVNAEDSSGDRILAAELLALDGVDAFDLTTSHDLTVESRQQASPDSQANAFRRARVASKFKRTKKSRSKLSRSGPKNDKNENELPLCRIYGSFDVNKVQGDLHITAKNYGYRERTRTVIRQEQLNFSHVFDELSFGAYYPRLENPLDGVAALVDHHMFRYQYYVSIVPTTYVGRHVVRTNQYAVTEKPTSLINSVHPPGIYIKYDIEPLGLTIRENRTSFLKFLIRIVNVIGGLVVCTGWVYPLMEGIWTKWANRGKSTPHVTQTLLDKGLKGNN
ncbi:endoplasmic reticulum vesicle transporter-domain-containing protein [Lipomyces japonicus]|uniref:endoplasmic reticulum vesicle transporter-domain-containing protein n=1 Tax=Lipomyces japonicus TaxID=56871 RepID=UPI0034CD19C3